MSARTIPVHPLILYPRLTQTGRTYLLTVDLEHHLAPDEWLYEQEEYPLTCLLESLPYFEHQPQGDPTLIMHRFGGTYGEVRFAIKATEQLGEARLRLMFVNSSGLPVHTAELPGIQIVSEGKEIPRYPASRQAEHNRSATISKIRTDSAVSEEFAATRAVHIIPPHPTVFIGYSHKDEAWKEHLMKHLATLERDGLIHAWNDRLIRVGQKWLPEIEAAIEEARVAVLLVSPHLLASKFIQTREFQFLLENRIREGMRIVPVIVKDCLWEEELSLSELQPRPLDGRPLSSYRPHERDSELEKIAKEILDLLDEQALPVPAPGLLLPRISLLSPLHQLPPPPADFTGRETDLAELRAAVQSGGVAISGVRGMGGIGKTALALKLAQELAPQYPDAQIYLDLQGVSPHPLLPAHAMAHVIRAFHPDIRLPESEAEIAALYRSALHGKRALLLMDNAAGVEQVRPLIPPEGCFLLVTSRFFFHLPGFQVKDLDEMPLEEARALLLRIAPRIESQAERIAKVCAGVPFALRQAAGTLAERPDLSPASYAFRLEKETARLGLIEASMSLSYELLPEELSIRWRTLSVFPFDFDAPAASAIWDLRQETAEISLGDLIRRSLIEGDDGRYRLHDLARIFADSRCGGEERTEAQRRHAAYYQNVLSQAEAQYLQGGSTLLRGLKLIDLEWPNIRTGQAWAAERVNDPEIAELALGYLAAGLYCLDLRLQATEKIAWIESALKAARQLGDRSWEGRALGNLGLAYAGLGETRRAVEFYQQQLAISREIGDLRGEGAALGNLGLSYTDFGEIRRAVEFYEQQLAIARKIDDRRGEANATGNLGIAYRRLGETSRAIEFYEQQLAIAREIGDRRGEEIATGNIGIAYADFGEPRRAIEFYEQQLAIAREIGDRLGEGIATGNLGIAYTDLGETRRAIALFEHQLVISREIGDRRREGIAMGNLGIAYAGLGEPLRAIELYEQQRGISREIGDRHGEGIACWNLGLALENLGETHRAAEVMQVYVDYEREIGHPDADKHAAQVESLRASIGASKSPEQQFQLGERGSSNL